MSPAAPCPVCNKVVAPRAQNKAHPFCSPRCQAVDLGKWLGEEYRFPARPEDLEEGHSSEPEPSDS